MGGLEAGEAAEANGLAGQPLAEGSAVITTARLGPTVTRILARILMRPLLAALVAVAVGPEPGAGQATLRGRVTGYRKGGESATSSANKAA